MAAQLVDGGERVYIVEVAGYAKVKDSPIKNDSRA
jgi:hypothetical protein